VVNAPHNNYKRTWVKMRGEKLGLKWEEKKGNLNVTNL
jgi:hypothetical protein